MLCPLHFLSPLFPFLVNDKKRGPCEGLFLEKVVCRAFGRDLGNCDDYFDSLLTKFEEIVFFEAVGAVSEIESKTKPS
jgi:hypothetical protein